MRNPSLSIALISIVSGACGSAPEPAEPTPPPSAEEPSDEAFEAEPAVGVEESSEPEEQEPLAVGSEHEEKPLGATVEETRTTEVIREVVMKNRDSVRVCYDSLSMEEKGSGGTLTISFKIGSKGDVQEAKLNEGRSSFKLPKLVDCAAAAIKKMKFPHSSRGFESSVNYPFDFKP